MAIDLASVDASADLIKTLGPSALTGGVAIIACFAGGYFNVLLQRKELRRTEKRHDLERSLEAIRELGNRCIACDTFAITCFELSKQISRQMDFVIEGINRIDEPTKRINDLVLSDTTPLQEQYVNRVSAMLESSDHALFKLQELLDYCPEKFKGELAAIADPLEKWRLALFGFIYPERLTESAIKDLTLCVTTILKANSVLRKRLTDDFSF